MDNSQEERNSTGEKSREQQFLLTLRDTHTFRGLLWTPSTVSLFMPTSSVAAVDKQGSPAGGKSRNGWRNFSHRLWSIASHCASWAEGQERLLQAPLSSLPYSPHWMITLSFPCSSQQSMLLHTRELLRSMGSAENSAARGCSCKELIYGRGILFLRSPWRLTQSIYHQDNVGLRITQVQWAQALGRLEHWYPRSQICLLFSS